MNSIGKNCGQAVVEYLMLFSLMSLIGIGFVKGVGSMIDESVGSLSFELSQQLSTGVCDQLCFNNSYKN